MREGWQPTLYFYNPNIQPQEEYVKRLETLESIAQRLRLSLKIGAYDSELWEEQVAVWGGPYPCIADSPNQDVLLDLRMKRCSACYKLRFKALAVCASELKISYIDTTLSISPYQFTQAVQESLQASAAEQGITALTSDWRASYNQSLAAARRLNLYRQNYCGCRFSRQEAELERSARRAGKAARLPKTQTGRDSSEN